MLGGEANIGVGQEFDRSSHLKELTRLAEELGISASDLLMPAKDGPVCVDGRPGVMLPGGFQPFLDAESPSTDLETTTQGGEPQ